MFDIFVIKTKLTQSVHTFKDCGWSDWASWSACSVTCGTGLKHRDRLCNNPVPSATGKTCPGNSDDVNLCLSNECAMIDITDGGWSGWKSWSDCSATCGTGLKRRQRTCDNPVPSVSGKNCIGDASYVDVCTITNCNVNSQTKIDGEWSEWSHWSECIMTDGVGVKRRQRACDSPVPSEYGRNCLGNTDDLDICSPRLCSGDNWFRVTISLSKHCVIEIVRISRLSHI